MNLIEEITAVLLLLGPDDLEAARNYLEWMKIRRQINNRFYFIAHWVGNEKRYHWIG